MSSRERVKDGIPRRRGSAAGSGQADRGGTLVNTGRGRWRWSAGREKEARKRACAPFSSPSAVRWSCGADRLARCARHQPGDTWPSQMHGSGNVFRHTRHCSGKPFVYCDLQFEYRMLFCGGPPKARKHTPSSRMLLLLTQRVKRSSRGHRHTVWIARDWDAHFLRCLSPCDCFLAI